MADTKRIRRTSEEARRVILDAAEQVMARTGPAGLRLQEVAAAAGISHPAILHHFESREGLIRALNWRTFDELGEALRAQLEAPVDPTSPGEDEGGGVRAAFAAYRGGLAQRMVWLMQSGTLPADAPAGPDLAEQTAQRLHAIRCQASPPDAQPDLADSRAVVHLISVAALGDALIGPRARRAVSEAEEVRAREAFETWLAALVNAHIRGL